MKSLALIAAFTATLAFGQSIYSKKDNFSGVTRFYTKDQQPDLVGGSFFSMRYIYFHFGALKPIINKEKPYGIYIESHTQGWVFIQPGESLLLKVDGEMIPIKGDGSSNNRDLGIGSGSVMEHASWYISYDQLLKLSKAKEIQFRVIGSKQILTGTWTPRIMADLKLCAEKLPELIGDPLAQRPNEEINKSTPITPEALVDKLNKEFKENDLPAKWVLDGNSRMVCLTSFSIMGESKTKNIRDGFASSGSEKLRNEWKAAGIQQVVFRVSGGQEYALDL